MTLPMPSRPLPGKAGPPHALRAALALAVLALAGCAVSPAAAPQALVLPAQWQAAVPADVSAALAHKGQLQDLAQWWQRQNDPLLVELVLQAQAVSPSIAAARSNIEQARATRVAAGAALLPSLNGTASVSRGRASPVGSQQPRIAKTASLGLQAAWEIDLFGHHGSARDADQQRLEGSSALWHAARVSVAAETANQYYSLRACQKLLALAQSDATSRGETARLAELSSRAGFQAPASAALARASAAESRGNATEQRAQCDLDFKGLVALTALDEMLLRQKIAQAPPDAPPEAAAPLVSVPAQLLGQRPDIFNAAREVDAAHADVGAAQALRYPRLGLSGSVNTTKSFVGSSTLRFDTWSIGPLQLSLPIFDGGASKANVDAAIARYDNAATQFRGSVRQAVREVEDALVNLQRTSERAGDADVSVAGYQASFTGTEARYKSGLASLVELEDARRFLLSAQSTVVNLERGRRSAWVALYRALGGGWTPASPTPSPEVQASSP